MTWKIRRMREEDVDTVYAIESTVQITPWSKVTLRDCVVVGYDCMVLEILTGDDQWLIVGFMICRIRQCICHILNFCIAKHYQGQGYGRQFLECVLTAISEAKTINNAILEVRPSNKAALHLYQSTGFEQIELKKDYYNDNEQLEDAFVLKKIFPV